MLVSRVQTVLSDELDTVVYDDWNIVSSQRLTTQIVTRLLHQFTHTHTHTHTPQYTTIHHQLVHSLTHSQSHTAEQHTTMTPTTLADCDAAH